MKYIIYVYIIYLSCNALYANKITNYEYWFDYNYANKVSVEIDEQLAEFNLSENIDFTEIVQGIHTFNIRFRDSLNKWSITQTSYFYKPAYDSIFEKFNHQNNSLIAYEYWIDDDFVNKINREINPNASIIELDSNFSLESLISGIHKFVIRFKDVYGNWSVPLTSYFYKPAIDSNYNNYVYQNNTLTEYEYWIDDDFNNRKIFEINPNSSIINLDSNFSLENIISGIHKFVIRFKDNHGKWSAAQTSYFYKPDNITELKDFSYNSNKIYGYRWWFDSKPETMFTAYLENAEEIYSDIINLQCPKLDSVGLHVLHIQYLDSVGKWSVAVSDTFLYEGFAISKPILKSPENNGIVEAEAILKWNMIPYITKYFIEISDTNDFSNIIVFDSLFNQTQYELIIPDSKSYYWRVKAEFEGTFSEWSEIWLFRRSSGQSITLVSGWNMISTFFEPLNPALEDVFSPIVGSTIIVKNNAGQIYYPEFEINDIGDWDIRQGYQVYMTQNSTLSMEGNKIVPEITEITLIAGWNMIAYLRDNPLDIEIALATLVDTDNLVIAKDNFGNVFYPAFEINMIGDMMPGQGYQLYLLNDDELTYPEN